MESRQNRRFTKRLETTFSSGSSKYRGITSDLSSEGIFIRTQHGLMPGSVIDIEIYLPTQTLSRLKGIVRRTVKTPLSMLKNGMGVELIERDLNYIEFLKTFRSETDKFKEPAPLTPAGNLHERANEEATEKTLRSKEEDEKPGKSGLKTGEPILVRCSACRAKNRVQREALPLSPKCGKCGTVLDIPPIK
ncbi:MAG: PilZ domain-containing protein [Thermodesulfovibrionales bacterium]|jgi:hypothetical protein